jgi:GAF domain-containing protein
VLDALKMILLGAPLNEVLTTITRVIEAHSTGMLCSISLLDEDGLHLRYGVAASLPEAYRAATDGICIGPNVGSCGTAAYLRQPVFVSDIASDPRWVKFRHFAIQNGLRAAWSTPMMSHDGKVLGTFCMYYYGEVRHPGPAEIQLIDYVTRIAGIAIMENTRRRRKPVSAEAIARLADEGRDVSRFFTNKGRMIDPIQRVNVHLAAGMLEELDRVAKELNISRRAVIKTLIRQALDQQYLARRSAASVKAEIAQNPCGNPPVRHSERRAHIQERIIAERLLPLRSVRENGARNRETK